MKKIITLTAMLASAFLSKFSFAQNLVPNSSFEAYTYCPYGYNAFAGNVINWKVPNTASTDYFNSCDTFLNSTSTPNNVAGFQFPYSGNGYAGIVLFTTQGSYREYVQCQLDSPLHASSRYCLDYYLSLADSAGYAVSNVGAVISIGAISDSLTNEPLNYLPQLQNTNGILNDKLNWTRISGCFLASGGEDHLTIGNFQVDSLTDTLRMPFGGFGKTEHSYYFIDDISLTEDISHEDIENIREPFFLLTPNPIKDLFKISSNSSNNIVSSILYNYNGMFVRNFNIRSKDEIFDTSDLASGVYVLK